MPGITKENVGKLTPIDLLQAVQLFEAKMAAGPLG